jgi:hypothetical protein
MGEAYLTSYCMIGILLHACVFLGQIIIVSNIKEITLDWRCGSSGRAPALQVPSPEFKPKSHPTK